MWVKKMKEVLFEPQPLQLSTKEEAIRLSSANNSFPSRPTVFVKKNSSFTALLPSLRTVL